MDEVVWLIVNGMGYMKLILEVDGEFCMGKVVFMEGIEIMLEIKVLICLFDLSLEGIYCLVCN